ncbi:MAG: MATE family efflux transporter [Pseudomonadota bacterium]
MKPDRQSRLDDFLAHPRRAVWTVSLPMMAGMIFHTLYSVVDTAFVGQIGPEALAAITFVGPLFFVAVALTNGLATGVTAVIAQAVGRRDAAAADRTASNSMALGIVLGVLLSVGWHLTGPGMLRAMGAEGATVGEAWAYFQLITLGLPLFFISSVLRAVLNGEGDSRSPMVVMAIATVVNLVLDPIFIFVLDQGIRGAAIATILSQVIATAIFAWWVLVRRRTFTHLSLRGMLPSGAVLWRVMGIGVPTTFAQLVMSAGMVLGNWLLATFGQLTVAGYGAGTRVDMIVSMPILGLASGAVAVIGMFAGAGRADLVRSTALYTYRWALFLGVGVGLLAFASSPWVLRLFTQDPVAIGVGQTYLGYMIFSYPLMAVGMTSGRILQGLGYGLPSLVITAIRVLLVGVPVAYFAVLVLHTPLDGVWIGFIIGGACSVALGLTWVYRLVWQRDPTLRAAAA